MHRSRSLKNSSSRLKMDANRETKKREVRSECVEALLALWVSLWFFTWCLWWKNRPHCEHAASVHLSSPLWGPSMEGKAVLMESADWVRRYYKGWFERNLSVRVNAWECVWISISVGFFPLVSFPFYFFLVNSVSLLQTPWRWKRQPQLSGAVHTKV